LEKRAIFHNLIKKTEKIKAMIFLVEFLLLILRGGFGGIFFIFGGVDLWDPLRILWGRRAGL
jgi:hypothetical protein